MIRFDSVSRSYRDAPVPALSAVSFEVEPGRTLAVLGPNGSGKSTLARLANGILLPDTGAVTVDGLDTSDAASCARIRPLVGSVFQRPDDQIVATSVEDDVAFGPENLGLPPDEIRARVSEALSAVGLSGMERREPHMLSGGQKQRLAIAGALAMRPRYLVLDEPTSMIDVAGRAEILAILDRRRAMGCGILRVTHDVSEAMLADRVLILDQGVVAFIGSPEDLIRSGLSLSDLGLEVPRALRLVLTLREAGVIDGDGMPGPAGIVEALCR